MASEIEELARRCEQAVEGDREIVREVAKALNAEVQWVRVGPDYRRAVLAVIDRSSGAAPVSRPAAAALRSIQPPEDKEKRG